MAAFLGRFFKFTLLALVSITHEHREQGIYLGLNPKKLDCFCMKLSSVVYVNMSDKKTGFNDRNLFKKCNNCNNIYHKSTYTTFWEKILTQKNLLRVGD